jgi:hypothetical protein
MAEVARGCPAELLIIGCVFDGCIEETGCAMLVFVLEVFGSAGALVENGPSVESDEEVGGGIGSLEATLFAIFEVRRVEAMPEPTADCIVEVIFQPLTVGLGTALATAVGPIARAWIFVCVVIVVVSVSTLVCV